MDRTKAVIGLGKKGRGSLLKEAAWADFANVRGRNLGGPGNMMTLPMPAVL